MNTEEKDCLDILGILNRLKSTLNIKKDISLAELLNVKQSTISTWKSRSSLDYPKIILFCKENGLSLDEIFLNKSFQQIEKQNEFKSLIFSIIDEYYNKES